MDNELKEYLLGMEKRLTQEIQEAKTEIKDLQAHIKTLEHRVITLDKTIRIVDQYISATLSGLRIDVELVKGELCCTAR